MKCTIEIDKKDIEQAIAEVYRVQPESVQMEIYEKCEGYGTNERYVSAVRAYIEVDKSVRM